jgi:hypothetical protein
VGVGGDAVSGRDRQPLVEDVPEAGAVAEAPELDPEHGAVGAVLGAWDVADVGLPAAGVAAVLEPFALAAANRRRVLVAVEAVAGRDVLSSRSRRASAFGRLSTSVRGQPRRREARKWRRMWGYFDAQPSAAVLARALRAPLDEAGLDGDLCAAVELRMANLQGYQSARYARAYLDDVLAVLAAERERAGAGPAVVTAAYALGLHKLMAYKDEYEVARLHLDGLEMLAAPAPSARECALR